MSGEGKRSAHKRVTAPLLDSTEAAKKRRDRCRGDLRSSAAAEHACRAPRDGNQSGLISCILFPQKIIDGGFGFRVDARHLLAFGEPLFDQACG